MEREEIRPCEHLVEARAVHAELAEPLGRDERVVRDDLHLEANGTPGDLTADPPEPKHSERLVGELDPAPLRTLPPAGRQRRVSLRDVAREREQQPDRVLGGRDDVRLGRVRHDDPAPGRSVDVDVVDADAGPADDLQPRGARDHIRRDLRRGTDDQALVAVDDLLERRVRVDVDLEMLTQQVDARIRDLLTDEDAHRQTLTGVSNASNARGDGDAALDVRAELGQRELHRRERGGDVEDVEPADVPDPEDLPLQVLLARGECDAVSVAEMQQQLVTVDAVRRSDGGHDGGRVVVGREELEPHRLHSGAGGAAQANVPFEPCFERVVEDQSERDVKAADQRDGRCERCIEGVLCLLVPAPVEVKAARRLRALEHVRRHRGHRKPGWAHERLLRA